MGTMRASRLAILVCSLGYFVDVYDIQLFAVLRVASLTAIGVKADQLASVSSNILSFQMAGMVLGAFLWGWMGDRFGRAKALYGSILVYSIGTIACSLVQDSLIYAALRFVTGFGLAGEVGVAVVLISELLPTKSRGWAVTIMGAIGFLGPVFAVLTSFLLNWRQTYIFAGLLGFVLLALRIKLIEPAVFQKLDHKVSLKVFAGTLLRKHSIMVFLFCLVTALPLCYAWNLLNFFSLEFSRELLSPNEAYDQRISLLVFFLATSIGDILGGVLTQSLRSRKKAMVCVHAFGAIFMAVLLVGTRYLTVSEYGFYAIYFALGLPAGCWALATMITAEHFGTNIRATGALVMLNLLRGFTIPMVFVFQQLKTDLGLTVAALAIGVGLYAAAFIAIGQLSETFSRDLDFVE